MNGRLSKKPLKNLKIRFKNTHTAPYNINCIAGRMLKHLSRLKILRSIKKHQQVLRKQAANAMIFYCYFDDHFENPIRKNKS